MKATDSVKKAVSVFYRPAIGLMVVDFADRGQYIYHDVPAGVYDALRGAPARVHARFIQTAGHNYSAIRAVGTR
jgi:hypothetical protein